MTFGLMDVHRHEAFRRLGLDLRVWLDGVDVTVGCRAADDVGGCVLMLEQDQDGRHFLRDGDVACVRRCGTVEILPVGDAPTYRPPKPVTLTRVRALAVVQEMR